MEATYIFQPVIVMVVLTFITIIKVGRARVKFVVDKQVDYKYFLTNQGETLPPELAKLERHYNNLLEMPILFYLWAIILFVTNNVDAIALGLAWAYVLTRCIHSYIHLGSNKLMKRRKFFIYSLVVLLIAWIWLGLKLYLLA